jgi:hypothetical protein
MNTAQVKVKKNGRAASCAAPVEYKVVALRECAAVAPGNLCDTPPLMVDYWRKNVETQPQFNGEVETLVVVMLDARHRVKGHHFISSGLVNSLLVHPRETFRAAIIAGACQVVLMHNHPRGDPSPSETDLRLTRNLIRAGCLLQMDVADHVIMGLPSAENKPGYISLSTIIRSWRMLVVVSFAKGSTCA